MRKTLIALLTLLFCFWAQEASASEGVVRYTVKKGDCITKIARLYHEPADLIAAMNSIAIDEPIKPGDKLIIPIEPEAEQIVLKKGDNPWDIARKYGVTTEKLLASNNIDNPQNLMPGDILSIPVMDFEDGFDYEKVYKAQVTERRVKKARMRVSYRNQENFFWPVHGVISQPYDSAGEGENHHGLDIAADYGTAIVAATSGKVVQAGYKNSIYGYAIMIESGPYTLLYGHLSKVFVDDGQEVEAGQAIGRVGDSGRSTGPHVHFEVRTSDGTLNPMRFLQ